MNQMVELIPIQDVFCSGLGKIEHLEGNLLRFVLYTAQSCADGTIEKVIVAKLVMSVCVLPDAIMMATAALGQHAEAVSLVIGLAH